MNDPFGGLNRQTPTPLAAQIRHFVRELILSERVVPGQKLPSTQELARKWKTHAPTVQAALAPLMKEGLLVRNPGIGTFVRRREEKLTCIGLYYAEDVWLKKEAAFSRSVHRCLQERCEALGIRTQVFLDPRRGRAQYTPWEALARAAERREIQGLIATSTDWPHWNWMKKVPVPSTLLATANLPNVVRFDMRQFAELSLRSLRQQGCRSVGLIAPMDPQITHPDGSRHPVMDFFEHFTDTARELGLELRNEWIIATTGDVLPERTHEEFGYRRFQEFWRTKQHPQGLVVLPDSIAPGVILALREQQVDVPGKLKLVFQKNEAVELLCPMPATFVVASEREVARALVSQVEKQFRGEVCEPIIVSHRLLV